MMRFQIRYFVSFLMLFIIEIGIAYYGFQSWVRGYLGDVISVIMLYTLLRSLFKLKQLAALLLSVLLAFSLELAQLFSIAEILQIQNPWLRIAIGNHFDPLDLMAYCLGGILIELTELWFKRRQHNPEGRQNVR